MILLGPGVMTILPQSFGLVVFALTFTVNAHVAVLLLASLAVYVTVVAPTANAAPDTCVPVTVTAPGQLSVAVGAVHVAVAVVAPTAAVFTILAGQSESTGLVRSFVHGSAVLTVTVNAHVAVLLLASLAVYVTVVAPTANAAPDTCVPVTVTAPGQLSVAVGAVHVAVAVVAPAAAVFTILAGQAVSTGLVRSFVHGSAVLTVTVNAHVAVLLLASLAVYVTVVAPTANAAPDTYVPVTVTAPGQLSVAVGAVHVAVAVVAPAAAVFTILAGQAVSTGAVKSLAHGFDCGVTVTTNEQVDLLSNTSVAT